MLFRTLKRMIERGNTEGLAEKIDIFFAAGKLTTEEYTELTTFLNLLSNTETTTTGGTEN